ncbi:hypothetical protein GGX14DRAFT_402657 [Mycena pura]|uniref:Uncharacterized protein n=1 Tax=Mycena pura TaxID=153505 RepID=A0AAD6V4Z8_9AGAR|nr:hypothetical protein GGX14DRAFT_402657 [Mycena pura]
MLLVLELGVSPHCTPLGACITQWKQRWGGGTGRRERARTCSWERAQGGRRRWRVWREESPRGIGNLPMSVRPAASRSKRGCAEGAEVEASTSCTAVAQYIFAAPVQKLCIELHEKRRDRDFGRYKQKSAHNREWARPNRLVEAHTPVPKFQRNSDVRFPRPRACEGFQCQLEGSDTSQKHLERLLEAQECDCRGDAAAEPRQAASSLPEVTRVAEESLCVIYNNLRDATVVGSKTPEARRAITVMTRLGGGFTSSAALPWLQKPLERFLGRVRALHNNKQKIGRHAPASPPAGLVPQVGRAQGGARAVGVEKDGRVTAVRRTSARRVPAGIGRREAAAARGVKKKDGRAHSARGSRWRREGTHQRAQSGSRPHRSDERATHAGRKEQGKEAAGPQTTWTRKALSCLSTTSTLAGWRRTVPRRRREKSGARSWECARGGQVAVVRASGLDFAWLCLIKPHVFRNDHAENASVI